MARTLRYRKHNEVSKTEQESTDTGEGQRDFRLRPRGARAFRSRASSAQHRLSSPAPFGGFLLEDVFCRQSRKAQYAARIAEDSIRPEGVGGFLKSREIFGTHFNVDLDRAFSARFHPLYRYVRTLCQQRYCWYCSYQYEEI